jgi:hypothetical protein
MRVNGYYKVKMKYQNHPARWAIALYSSGIWYLCGQERGLDDSWFLEIGEQILL